MKYLLIVGQEAHVWPESAGLEDVVNNLERLGTAYSCTPLNESEGIAS